MAVAPACRAALDAAGLAIGDVDAVKSHNPFAVNVNGAKSRLSAACRHPCLRLSFIGRAVES